MGRTILAEERIQKQLEEYFRSNDLTVGLIIGKSWSQKDFAVHLARTPQQEDQNESQEAETKHKKSAAKKTEKILTGVDDYWIANHAKQVTRMLPGGLEVVGVFSMGHSQHMQNAMAKLRGVLYAIQKLVCKAFPQQPSTTTDTEPVHRVALHICSTTRKVVCRTYNVADTKCSAEPAEWKYQAFVDRWVELNTSHSVDLIMPVYTSQIDSVLHSQLQSSLQPICDNIYNSMCTIEGRLLTGSQSIIPADASQSGGKKKKGKAGEPVNQHSQFDVQLYANMSSRNNADVGTSVTECGAKLWIRGTMTCRAYVHPKSSMDDTARVIKEDAVRTLCSRCDLVCEDLLQSEEDQDTKVLYETPIRVYGKLDDTPVYFCDYMFPDEVATDSMDRFQELTDITLTESNMQLDAEIFPDGNDVLKPDRYSKSQTGLAEDGSASSSFTGTAGLIVSGAMAALAAALSYIYLGQE